MSDYTAREVDQATGRQYFWTELVEEEDGYVTAILLQGEPVVMYKVAGEAGDYELTYSSADQQDVFVVVKVGTQFFKKTGYYTSHSGSNWTGALREVKATTKNVTVYE